MQSGGSYQCRCVSCSQDQPSLSASPSWKENDVILSSDDVGLIGWTEHVDYSSIFVDSGLSLMFLIDF